MLGSAAVVLVCLMEGLGVALGGRWSILFMSWPSRPLLNLNILTEHHNIIRGALGGLQWIFPLTAN
jgi:hypothetical protein